MIGRQPGRWAGAAVADGARAHRAVLRQPAADHATHLECVVQTHLG